MPKRKRSDDEDHNEMRRLRKIRKLEKKLRKYQSKLAPSDPEIDHDENEETSERYEDVMPTEIISALGNTLEPEEKYAPEISPNITEIIENILTSGLSKENRDEFIKGAKIPKNCKLLEAPSINAEILSLLPPKTTERDTLLTERQQDLGLAMAKICQALNNLTKDQYDKISVIRMLGESSRLLANLHFQYTVIRRKLINPFLDHNLSQNLKDNKRSEYLYSELEESVKTNTAMKRTANILKPKNQPKNYQTARRQGYQGKPGPSNIRAPVHHTIPQSRIQYNQLIRPPPPQQPFNRSYNQRPYQRKPPSRQPVPHNQYNWGNRANNSRYP